MSESPTSPASDAIAVARLAAMAPMEYDRVRDAEAKALGIRVAVLDTMVRQTRPASDKPPDNTDEALALGFTERHKNRLRYVAAWGKWMIHDSVVWRFDETMQSFDYSRAICREAAATCGNPDAAKDIASAKTVAAVERLAKADRRHAAVADQWDKDPWLLNTPGGVVNLRTGRIRSHSPDDCMTKITAAAPDGDCPLWRAFLVKITNGNNELQAFLQRFSGYALTGSIREHALVFGYGVGRNGKGTFLNTISGIMADYAAVAGMETFTASLGDRHPTDLAMLRGARLVTAQETEEGRQWAEARIKAMTGGDPITARFMRQDFFTYNPQFKLFIIGNHKPIIRNVDEAMRARLNLVPFLVTIPKDERDNQLSEKLREEWPGILQWMIDGCLEWQVTGLAPPGIVAAATDDYIAQEDTFSVWLRERCRQTGSYTETGVLFADWRKWVTARGEEAGSQKRFSQAMEGKGYERFQSPADRSAFNCISLDNAQASYSENLHERD